jgi:hypothetical protein
VYRASDDGVIVESHPTHFDIIADFSLKNEIVLSKEEFPLLRQLIEDEEVFKIVNDWVEQKEAKQDTILGFNVD